MDTSNEMTPEEDAMYEKLIAATISGYNCNRGKARRIIKSHLRKAVKKVTRQKKVN